jgi:hypothetical protein
MAEVDALLLENGLLPINDSRWERLIADLHNVSAGLSFRTQQTAADVASNFRGVFWGVSDGVYRSVHRKTTH